MLSFRRLFFFATIVLNVYGAASENKRQNPPAAYLPPLKPRAGKPFPQAGSQRETSVIPGLLVSRACPAGYGLCSNNGLCCQTGGYCCTSWCA
jgi:hypothetical protein